MPSVVKDTIERYIHEEEAGGQLIGGHRNWSHRIEKPGWSVAGVSWHEISKRNITDFDYTLDDVGLSLSGTTNYETLGPGGNYEARIKVVFSHVFWEYTGEDHVVPTCPLFDNEPQYLAHLTSVDTHLDHLHASAKSNAQRLVRQSYCRVLGRPADASGLAGWADWLLGHHTVRELVKELVLSDEYRHSVVDPIADDERAVVAKLYDHLLARDPDADGLNAWEVVVRNEGYERAAEGLIASVEYSNHFGEFKVPGNGRPGCS